MPVAELIRPDSHIQQKVIKTLGPRRTPGLYENQVNLTSDSKQDSQYHFALVRNSTVGLKSVILVPKYEVPYLGSRACCGESTYDTNFHDCCNDKIVAKGMTCADQ